MDEKDVVLTETGGPAWSSVQSWYRPDRGPPIPSGQLLPSPPHRLTFHLKFCKERPVLSFVPLLLEWMMSATH